MIRKFLPLSALAWCCCALGGEGISLDWEKTWDLGADWRLGGYLEVTRNTWQNTEKVATLGAAPVFRIEKMASSVAPYVEGAIGWHLLSQVEANQSLSGTRLQRGDQLGIGLRFGEQRRHDIGLRLQYFADGGVARPESGLAIGTVRYQYNFD